MLYIIIHNQPQITTASKHRNRTRTTIETRNTATAHPRTSSKPHPDPSYTLRTSDPEMEVFTSFVADVMPTKIPSVYAVAGFLVMIFEITMFCAISSVFLYAMLMLLARVEADMIRGVSRWYAYFMRRRVNEQAAQLYADIKNGVVTDSDEIRNRFRAIIDTEERIKELEDENTRPLEIRGPLAMFGYEAALSVGEQQRLEEDEVEERTAVEARPAYVDNFEVDEYNEEYEVENEDASDDSDETGVTESGDGLNINNADERADEEDMVSDQDIMEAAMPVTFQFGNNQGQVRFTASDSALYSRSNRTVRRTRKPSTIRR